MNKDIKRTDKALKKYRDNLLREMESLDNFLECSLENYDFMIDFAKKKGFERIIDIGCAFGHQSELCGSRIRYVGINEDKVNFYNILDRKVTYSVGKYPFHIPFNLYKNDLAISNLAIGWQCYANEEETEKQFEALSKDFKASLLYLPKDREELLRLHFKKVEIVKEDDDRVIPVAFYYCEGDKR